MSNQTALTHYLNLVHNPDLKHGNRDVLSPVHLAVLHYLALAQTPPRFLDARKELGFHGSRMTHACYVLTNMGLIQRIPDQKDRRTFYLTLSPAGRRLVKQFEALFAPMTPKVEQRIKTVGSAKKAA